MVIKKKDKATEFLPLDLLSVWLCLNPVVILKWLIEVNGKYEYFVLRKIKINKLNFSIKTYLL